MDFRCWFENDNGSTAGWRTVDADSHEEAAEAFGVSAGPFDGGTVVAVEYNAGRVDMSTARRFWVERVISCTVRALALLLVALPAHAHPGHAHLHPGHAAHGGIPAGTILIVLAAVAVAWSFASSVAERSGR